MVLKLCKLHFALICPLRIFGKGTGPRKTDKILMKAPGPERLTKFWWRHRAPKDWQNFDEAREFSAVNFSRVCVASKICHYSKMPICCKVWFHWFTSRKHMSLLFMHRQLFLFERSMSACSALARRTAHASDCGAWHLLKSCIPEYLKGLAFNWQIGVHAHMRIIVSNYSEYWILYIPKQT